MTLPRDVLLAKVREWIAVADEDLRVAQHTLSLPSNCPHRMVAYHAQQSAEKYLKAYLVWRGVDFPYTHNIARLRELCMTLGEWAAKLEDADELSPFATTARYPGESLVVSETDARQSVVIAESVRRTVRQALHAEGAM